MLDLEQISFVGDRLARPECVLATSDGTLHVSDWRGGVTTIRKDGSQTSILAKGEFRPKPNGIAIHPKGGWLLAHLGDTDGGVYRLYPDGALKPVLLDIDNAPLPPTNYVHVDDLGRIWATVSTRKQPRSLGYRSDCNDGFVVLLDGSGARVVADGLGYTNECLIHPTTRQLFVNETFARRTLRFDVADNGKLGNKMVVATYGHGTYPDGLCFDTEGGFWITSIVSNRLIRVDANGRQTVVLEDVDRDQLDHVEAAYLAGTMGRPHLDRTFGRVLGNISSAAFGGTKLRTLYLGCLLGSSLATAESPVQGAEPFHWHWDPFQVEGEAP
ncbi:MAG: hypothetical protein HKN18_16010 [Silicimonas sp.]|nr:hypothetical protein [Silicimonas sp.]